MIKGHGGNVQTLAKSHNCSIDEIIDMSSNINPLGPPDGLEQFIAENIHLIRSLPQPDAANMVEAFSKYYNVPINRIMAGNGTTWFIYTLPVALKLEKVVIIAPTYSDYSDSCIINNVNFEYCMTDKESLFQPDISKISDMALRSDAVILCNPNNPTGTIVPKDIIVELLKLHPKTYFVVDESYLPFLEDAEKISLVSQTLYSNLIVLASMSKIFRIPGLRTGFLCASPDVIEKLMRYYQPWSVNALSQAATAHILNHPEIIRPFLEVTRSFVKEESKVFYDSLESIVIADVSSNLREGVSSDVRADVSSDVRAGVRTGELITLYPTHTFFVLAELKRQISSDQLCKKMGEHKILIRDCANFQGLSDRFVRFSLKDRETNLKLARILKATLNDNSR